MIVHEIITINKISNIKFINNLLLKSKSFYGGITKIYHVIWIGNKYIFTFARKLEVMSNN